MRILIVSWCFAPWNTVGAVRVTKLASFLQRQGHDVRVVSGGRQDVPPTLPMELDGGKVIQTEWLDMEWPVKRMAHFLGRHKPAAPEDGGDSSQGAASHSSGRGGRARSAAAESVRAIMRALSDHYFAYAVLPDKRIGWLPYAVRAGKVLARDWRPDLVYASGPPFTSLIAGKALARRVGVPWIAELRDPWFGTAYVGTDPLGIRDRLQNWLESRTVNTACAIVATNEPLTALYTQRYRKPSITIYNGYDPLPDEASDTPVMSAEDRTTLVICYTGHIYVGKRDPSPLFAAIARLDALDRSRVRVDFYGCEPRMVYPLAQAHGIEDRIRIHDPLPYSESLRVQQNSDILLLLQWNDERENLHLPAKLFEYLGSGRPIIGIGYEAGMPANIVRGRQAGIYDNDPKALATYLSDQIRLKQTLGTVPALSPNVRRGFGRTEQLDRLQSFIREQMHASRFSRRSRGRVAPQTILGADYVPIDLPRDEPLRLIVVCDTEEEFDWSEEFRRESRSITHLQYIERIQEIFDRHGLRPVYAVDYPVADQPEKAEGLRRIIEEGRGILGAHLQPWVSPPFRESLSPMLSYPGNLPADLEHEKLQHLTDRIVTAFGQRPRIYKAGRYGIGPRTAATLQALGYEIDLSVAPPMDLSGDGGPDYSAFDSRPFWFGAGRELIGIPNTGAFSGLLHRHGRPLHRLVTRSPFTTLRVPGLLSQLRLLERIRLSTEGFNVGDLKRVSRHLIRQGLRTLVLSFHSPSIAPGFTPYVRTEADLESFLASLDAFLAFAIKEFDAVPSTPHEVRAACERRRLEGAETSLHLRSVGN